MAGASRYSLVASRAAPARDGTNGTPCSYLNILFVSILAIRLCSGKFAYLMPWCTLCRRYLMSWYYCSRLDLRSFLGSEAQELNAEDSRTWNLNDLSLDSRCENWLAGDQAVKFEFQEASGRFYTVGLCIYIFFWRKWISDVVLSDSGQLNFYAWVRD